MELKEKYTIDDLIAIMERLRQPDGCPWDKVQTHQSIKKSMIEETYEAIDALDFGDDKAFANELGDVLLQVVFHAQIARERGAFDFTEIMTHMGDKWYEFSAKAGFGTVANDAAFVSQKLGAINPYEIEVEFYTTR